MLLGRIPALVSLSSVLATNQANNIFNVRLYVESNDTKINGSSLVGLHEGAGFNFLFLGNQTWGEAGDMYKHDTQHSLVYKEDNGGNKYFLSSWTPQEGETVIQERVSEENSSTNSLVTVRNGGYLLLNGSDDKFHTAKNLPYDPYGHSTDRYQLVILGGENSYPAKVRVAFAGL